MGEPIGDRYPPGNDCGICWGVGKTFGEGDTPEKVFLTWADLVGPWIGANKTFTATQDALDPDLWLWNDGTFQGYWTYTIHGTGAGINIIGFPEWIIPTGPLCVLFVIHPGGMNCTIS